MTNSPLCYKTPVLRSVARMTCLARCNDNINNNNESNNNNNNNNNNKSNL